MIACSDSRVEPYLIFAAEPGEMFVVRNVAGLVPPSTPDTGCHGTSAALEYGVLELGVEHVIVLGHSDCGGIEALLRGGTGDEPKSDFIGPWLSGATAARDRVLQEKPDAAHAEKVQALEYETVRQSLGNLMTFPWIGERVRAGALSLHGWHFDIAEGALSAVRETGEPVCIND